MTSPRNGDIYTTADNYVVLLTSDAIPGQPDEFPGFTYRYVSPYPYDIKTAHIYSHELVTKLDCSTRELDTHYPEYFL